MKAKCISTKTSIEMLTPGGTIICDEYEILFRPSSERPEYMLCTAGEVVGFSGNLIALLKAYRETRKRIVEVEKMFQEGVFHEQEVKEDNERSTAL